MRRLMTICGSLTLIFPVILVADDEIYIECPVDSLRTEALTKLPEGWWSTPQIGDLVDVQVDTIGGQRTLVCSYSAFGGAATVMREFPLGIVSCQPEGNGFKCSKTIDDMVAPSTTFEEVVDIQFGDPEVGDEATIVESKDVGTSQTEGCPDPAVIRLSMPQNQILWQPKTADFYFRLEGEIQNVGSGKYLSGKNKQSIELVEERAGGSQKTIAKKSFLSLSPGESIVITEDISGWRASDKSPPDFRLTISYERDIRADWNGDNDDCSLANNSQRLKGEEIIQRLQKAGER